MAGEISGISSSGKDVEEDSIDDESIEDLIANADDEEEIVDAISGETGIEGIERVLRGTRALSPEDEDSGEDDETAEISAELEGIDDQNELLKTLIARVTNQTNAVSNLSSSLSSINQFVEGVNRPIFVDTGYEEISTAEKSEDLVEEDNIQTISVLVKADHQNNGSLYVGGESVSVENGFSIEPGQEQVIPTDVSSQILKIVAEQAGDTYSYIALDAGV